MPRACCAQAHAKHSERAAASSAAVPPAGPGWTWTVASERRARSVDGAEAEQQRRAMLAETLHAWARDGQQPWALA